MNMVRAPHPCKKRKGGAASLGVDSHGGKEKGGPACQRRFLLFSFRYGEDAFRRRARYDRSDPLWEVDALLGKLSKTL